MEIIINPSGDPSQHKVEREKEEVDSLFEKFERYPGAMCLLRSATGPSAKELTGSLSP
jgi:hypothetical protein